MCCLLPPPPLTTQWYNARKYRYVLYSVEMCGKETSLKSPAEIYNTAGVSLKKLIIIIIEKKKKHSESFKNLFAAMLM